MALPMFEVLVTMIKESYRSHIPEEPKPAKDGDVPISMRDEEKASEGAAGFNTLEMGMEGFGQDPDNYEENHRAKTTEDKDITNVIDLLVEMGDMADEQGKTAFADFADFLLVKIAETKKEDPTILYNQLMIRVSTADLPNTNDVLKKLNNIFCRTFLIEYNKSQNIKAAKTSAYKKVLHRADQYLSEM
jgi:hypothetical protein